MRILILGSSVINKGAEAMLRTVQAELSARIPGVTFYIGDSRARQWHPDGIVEAGVPLAPIESVGRIRQIRALAKYGTQLPEGPRYWLRNRGRLAYIDALTDYVDAAVDVSGFLFSDQRGERAGEMLVPIVELFAHKAKPFVFLPQAWGPFEGPVVRSLTKRACTAASLVYARDATSLEHLHAVLGAANNVEYAPDIAFLFKPATNGPELIRKLGLDSDRPIVVISPNMRVYERTEGEGEANHYCTALVGVGRRMLGQGVQILLAPHEIMPVGMDRRDDRYLCSLLRDMLGTNDVAAITENTTAEDLKAMIGACDLMLGSRFHALIAALSSGVPTVAIGWAHKYPELLGAFEMEHLVFDHDALTQDALVQAVMEVWDTRSGHRTSIEKRLPEIRAASTTVFESTVEMISDKVGTSR